MSNLLLLLQRIIGEVEFYKITNRRIEYQENAINGEQQPLQGEFYGTDFNFLYSEEMQRAIAQNCLDCNWDQVMKFSQHTARQVHGEIGRYVNLNMNDLNFDENINEIVVESYKTTNRYIAKGVLSFCFYFFAAYTLIEGFLPVLAQNFPGTENETNSSSTHNGGTIREDALKDLDDVSENFTEAFETVKQQLEEEKVGEDRFGDTFYDDEDDIVDEIDEEEKEEEEKEAEEEVSAFERRLDPKEYGYSLRIFHLAFPVFGFIYHYWLRKVLKRKELLPFFIFKTCMFVGFLFLIIYTHITQD